MPILNWIGKEKVVSHHLDVPFRVLDKQYTFHEAGSGNKIIHGDNLEALKALLPEYEGKIKCIYIDPPYNTGNEDWRYNDNVSSPKIMKWLGELVGKESDDLARHDKWLCMMYPRLQLLHKLLDKDGAIFISLDENENVNLRYMMDEIFGQNNFVAQLILLCNPKGRSQDKYFSTNHEYITVYSKSQKLKDSFSLLKNDELINKEYKLSDAGGKYRLLDLRNTHREFDSENRPNLFYPFYVDAGSRKVSLTKSEIFSEEVWPLWPDGFKGCWTWGKELSEKDNHLLTASSTKGKWKISRKSYAVNAEGENAKKKLFTIWQDPKFYTEKGQSVFGDIFPGMNKNDFPQPKSVDLVKEIISTVTAENDIVLDSFAGSGTTAHAVLNLNKSGGGNRKFILIEMEDYADTVTAERVKRVIDGYGDKEGAGGGFDYYQLGEPLFAGEHAEYLNENVDIGKIRQYTWYTETRTAYVSTSNEGKSNYYLGRKDDTAYYFIYEKNGLTTLDHEMLSVIKEQAGQYIIYADNCLLSVEFMLRKNIFFKKIPRDITRF